VNAQVLEDHLQKSQPHQIEHGNIVSICVNGIFYLLNHNPSLVLYIVYRTKLGFTFVYYTYILEKNKTTSN